MEDSLVCALRAQRPQVRDSWATLLRVEPVGSPLGHPDALVHLIDWTLDEVFGFLSRHSAKDKSCLRPAAESAMPCACGRNPLLTYFFAGEQALREGLVLAQAASVGLDPIERDTSLAELNAVLQHIARREIEAFCGVCQFRQSQGAACTALILPFAQEPPES